MQNVLDEKQMKMLSESLLKHLSTLETDGAAQNQEKTEMLQLFLAAKRVEGCSDKSLRYYESTINNMLKSIGKPERQITTRDRNFFCKLRRL